MTLKATEQLFAEIGQFITDSRTLLDSGAMMEMQGLDDQVRTLCERIFQLSPEDRIAAAEPMHKLLNDLKEFGEDLVAQRERFADDIRSLSHQKKAAHAYKVVDASDDYGNREDE